MSGKYEPMLESDAESVKNEVAHHEEESNIVVSNYVHRVNSMEELELLNSYLTDTEDEETNTEEGKEKSTGSDSDSTHASHDSAEKEGKDGHVV